jgi:quercetin dioxygenase-like cupin family protein
MTGLPPNYKILVENRYARAYDIRIPAHSYEQRHTHHDRVVICLAGATLEHILPNGQKQPSTLKTGEIVWRPSATHVGHNLGSTELWVIVVEPK